MNSYQRYLYRTYWSIVYRQLQDAIFFTRPEVFPINFSTPNCLKLHISWHTCDGVHKTYEASLPFDENFPSGFTGVIECINEILCQASYGDCNCMAATLGFPQCY